MNYEIAITKKQYNNCFRKRGHQFLIVQDEEKKKEIKMQFPKFVNPIWQCSICNKIIESN